MASINHIDGAEKVLKALGYWPDFQGAEVISFSAERALPARDGGTVATIAVRLRLEKSFLVRFVFNGACDFALAGFNEHNAIDSVRVSLLDMPGPANLRAEIGSAAGVASGFGGSLRCVSAEIAAVEALAE